MDATSHIPVTICRSLIRQVLACLPACLPAYRIRAPLASNPKTPALADAQTHPPAEPSVVHYT